MKEGKEERWERGRKDLGLSKDLSLPSHPCNQAWKRRNWKGRGCKGREKLVDCYLSPIRLFSSFPPLLSSTFLSQENYCFQADTESQLASDPFFLSFFRLSSYCLPSIIFPRFKQLPILDWFSHDLNLPFDQPTGVKRSQEKRNNYTFNGDFLYRHQNLSSLASLSLSLSESSLSREVERDSLILFSLSSYLTFSGKEQSSVMRNKSYP